jgi:hypothetical protein
MVRKVVVLKPIYLFSIINEFINKTNKSHQIRSKKVRKLSLWVHNVKYKLRLLNGVYTLL